MSPCTKYRGPAGSLIISRPLEILKIDFSVFEKDREFENILLSTNVFTKFLMATAIRGEKKVSTVAKTMVENWLAYIGMSVSIQSNEGEAFEQSLIKRFCKIFRMNVLTTHV